MNKTYKYTIAANSYQEVTYDTGVAQLAISNADGTEGAPAYELPVASAETLGGIKVGENLSIEDGVLSAESGYTPLNYSTTEEQNTGIKWVDGKDIYVKTFSLLAQTSSTSEPHNIADLTDLNIGFVINIEGVGYVNSAQSNSPILSTGQSLSFRYLRDTKYLQYYQTFSSSYSIDVYCTVYYTKQDAWLKCSPDDRLRAVKNDGTLTNNYITIYKDCYLMLSSNVNQPTIAISLVDTGDEHVLNMPDYSWQGYPKKYTDCTYEFTYNGHTVYVSDYGDTSGDNHAFGCNTTTTEGTTAQVMYEGVTAGTFKRFSGDYGNDAIKYFIDNFDWSSVEGE